MNMTVYIEAMNKFPIADWGVYALLGFKKRGAPIRFYETIDEVPLNRYSLVVGSIEDTMAWFNAMQIAIPPPMTMPADIQEFAGRRVQLMTFGQALARVDYPYFLKPYSVLKQFVAGVIEKPTDKRWFSENDIPTDTTVLVSEVVEFVSEYRGYVINKELVGLKHYGGDFCIFPDTSLIKRAIDAYASQPAAYSIDFGITRDGRTLLVECNDFWSLGCYGLDPKCYVRGLVARWMEILRQNPVGP